MNKIDNSIKKILSKQFNYPIKKIKNTHIFKKKFKVDSLDMIELIMLLEEKFKLKLHDRNFNKLKTIQDIINYINLILKK